MGYIITAQQEPPYIKLYYHGNNKKGKPQFYWNIWNCSNRYLRVYKNKKTAERIAKRVQARVKGYQVSVENTI